MRVADEVVADALQAVPEQFTGPDVLRPAAVLLPLWEIRGNDHVLCTLRRDDLPHHAGQVSLPGGSRDPGEQPVETALRETCEEVGVPTDHISVLGSLTARRSVANHHVIPLVGRLDPEVQPVADPGEVARIVTIPLAVMADRDRWEFRPVPRRKDGSERPPMPHLDHDGATVWGLTAAFLWEFLRLTVDQRFRW